MTEQADPLLVEAVLVLDQAADRIQVLQTDLGIMTRRMEDTQADLFAAQAKVDHLGEILDQIRSLVDHPRVQTVSASDIRRILDEEE